MECSQPVFSERKICSGQFLVVAQRLCPEAARGERGHGERELRALPRARRLAGNQGHQDHPTLNIR